MEYYANALADEETLVRVFFLFIWFFFLFNNHRSRACARACLLVCVMIARARRGGGGRMGRVVVERAFFLGEDFLFF